MGIQVDFLAVGEGSRCGDAIAIRYGNLAGTRQEQTVITVDGGTLESGDALVDHLATHYGTNEVDIAILTHPDGDHAHGMRRILERINVKQVVMHLPWDHSQNVKALVDDDRTTVPSLGERAKKNLSAAHEIYNLATERKIPIVEPFSGSATKNGILKFLGPSREFYQQTLANFKFNPGTAFSESLAALLSKAAAVITEGWWTEKLSDPHEGSTSPENNSSAIFLIETEGKKLLFTGDAGVSALTSACDYADSAGISFAGVNFFDVPHHGSRRNLGPTILDRIFGKVRETDTPNWTAFVSAAKDGAPKHPNRKVLNALKRRGANVCATAGRGILWNHNGPRESWQKIEPFPFFTEVEGDE